MKKGFAIVMIVVLTLAVFASSAFAAPAQAGKNVSLKSVTYEESGIRLVFSVSGLTEADLQNKSFSAHSNQYEMSCKLVSDEEVRCFVSRSLSSFAGEGFHGTLAGFYFEGTLPKARTFAPKVIVTETPDVNEPPVEEEPTTCGEGEALVYEFDYYGEYEDWFYIDTLRVLIEDQEEFYSIYGMYYDTYEVWVDGGDGVHYDYWVWATYIDSGSSWEWAENWDAMVTSWEGEGYTIEKTGEYCGLIKNPDVLK